METSFVPDYSHKQGIIVVLLVGEYLPSLIHVTKECTHLRDGLTSQQTDIS